MVNALEYPGVVGDGIHDDTRGLQAALDSGASTVLLPTPPAHYLISDTLHIHSRQTIEADQQAVIRLADHAHKHMLTNADHAAGNARITITGGIWDGNNAHQTCEYHQGRGFRVPYDSARYLGVLMQFNRVSDLRIAHVTLKDPETFGIQAGNLSRFSIEDITFDYNLLRGNMDGVHIHGNSHQGRIANLKGTTNDDLVALNADDGEMFELSRGEISDILVDGVWSEDGYTAVRLLSAGSPVRRVKLANIFGSYRFNVVSFTNHRVHPGEPSIFDDISIEGIFCSKSARHAPGLLPGDLQPSQSPLWIDAPAVVSSLAIRDYHRAEEALPADDVYIETGARVENLVLDGVTVRNGCPSPLSVIHNRGAIENLGLLNVSMRGGQVIRNEGMIGRLEQMNVAARGLRGRNGGNCDAKLNGIDADDGE
jgi:hypothetical protein